MEIKTSMFSIIPLALEVLKEGGGTLNESVQEQKCWFYTELRALSCSNESQSLRQAALSKGGTEGKERRVMAHFPSNCLLSLNWFQN